MAADSTSNAEYLPLVDVTSGWPSRTPSRPDPQSQEQLGRYRIESILGSGGMATVYLASSGASARSRRWYALKLLRSELARDDAHLKMFLSEARIGSEITHPNVCHVLDYGSIDGRAYLAMEYLRGKSLAAVRRLLAEIPDPVRHASIVARLLADAAEGLDAIHEYRSVSEGPLRVVHRDISPDNLILTFDGFVKIIDFGLAKAEHRGEKTQSGILKGKLSYIAPELLRGRSPDRRADIWSLGVVAWELATGQRLFHRTTDAETLRAVIDDEIRPPSDVVPALPHEFDELVLRALARDPAERYASAAELSERVWEFLVDGKRLVHHRELASWLDRMFPGERERADHLAEVPASERPPSTPAETEPGRSRRFSSLFALISRLRRAAPRLWRRRARVSVIVALVGMAVLGAAGWTFSRLRPLFAAPSPLSAAARMALPAPAPQPGKREVVQKMMASGGFVVEIERPEFSSDIVVRVRATPSSTAPQRPLTPPQQTSSMP